MDVKRGKVAPTMLTKNLKLKVSHISQRMARLNG